MCEICDPNSEDTEAAKFVAGGLATMANALESQGEMMLRLEAIKLAVQVKSSTTDTREVIRSAHGIYSFIKTGNKRDDD